MITVFKIFKNLNNLVYIQFIKSEIKRLNKLQVCNVINTFTKFFSKPSVEDLFAAAATLAMNNSSDCEFSADEYSATINISDEQDNMVWMQVNIQKFEDDKHIIECTKISWDRFHFNKVFKELKGFYGGNVNADEYFDPLFWIQLLKVSITYF